MTDEYFIPEREKLKKELMKLSKWVLVESLIASKEKTHAKKRIRKEVSPEFYVTELSADEMDADAVYIGGEFRNENPTRKPPRKVSRGVQPPGAGNSPGPYNWF